MSVIVKGMEMPQNCKTCPFSDHEAWCLIPGDWRERYYCPDDERSEYCPLIELPPHVRLIDATFEENHYASMLLDPTPDVTEQDKHNARIIIDALRMAGTVIEAEGSET